MSLRLWALLGLLAAIWGSSYMFIALGLADVGPFALVFLRAALAALVVIPFGIRHRRTLSGRWPAMVVLALTQVAVPFLLITAAEQRIPSGLAGVLVASQPLWLAVLLPVVGSGRPAAVSAVGTVIGFGGVALVAGHDGSGAVDLVGVVMVLGAGLSYAFATWWARRTMTGVNPMAQTGAMLAVASVLVAPFAAFQVPHAIHLTSGAAILVLAVVGTGAAFIIFARLVKEAGPARASLVSYLAPAFALGYGATLLDEPLGIAGVAGLVLILAGSWLGTRSSARRAVRRAAVVPPVGVIPEPRPAGRRGS
ncbi:MAG: EamA family transporter [Streptosporangiales bacterium]|nr:EamA family transporter [Streptosporangiales bacterium]